MRAVALVAIGSALGGICRLLLSRWVMHHAGDAFPWAILSVNVLGSFLIGLLIASGLDADYKLLLTTGFCGGFTTFSTFSLEMVEMLRRAETTKAAAYALLSVSVCMAATWAGWRMGARGG